MLHRILFIRDNLLQRKISSLLFAAAMEYNSDIAPVISDAPKELTKGEIQL